MISTTVIATYFSYISNDYLLMLSAVLFYIFSKRSEHAHLIILLLFAMVYKATLKELLKIPAPVTSPTKYGFPSGHINFAVVFFGWFMVTYKLKLLYWLCPVAFVLASWSTIYLGYHDIYDVVLTPIFPIYLLIIYNAYLKQMHLSNFILTFIIISLLCQVISFFALDKMPIDVIIGSYGILGFSIGMYTNVRNFKRIFFSLILLLMFYILSSNLNKFMLNCIWFIAGGTLPVTSITIKQFISKLKHCQCLPKFLT